MKINNKFLDALTKKLKFFNQVDWSTILNSKDLLWLRSVQKTENQKHKFHLVSRSPWPILASMAGSSFLVGLLFWFHKVSTFLPLLLLGFILICLAMYLWFRDIIREGTYLGYHTKIVQRGLRIGFILFLISEVMFFFSFFRAYFHSSLNPSIWIGAVWPPEGIVHFFTEKSVTEGYFNLLTVIPDSIKPRLILFDANSKGGRLIYKNKYNGHFKNNGGWSDFYKTTSEFTELRNDVRIATMLYAEFIDNLGLNFTFLAKKKIQEHELELVYRRLFNQNIKSKYVSYAMRMGKFDIQEHTLRSADSFGECMTSESQIFPSPSVRNFYYFNTYFERYTYDPSTKFKNDALLLLSPQRYQGSIREEIKNSMLLELLTNDFPHAGIENTFGYIEFRYFAEVFAQRARFDEKPFFPGFVDYLLLGRRYDIFRSLVTNLVRPISNNRSTLDSTVANVFIKQFKNECVSHLIINSNPMVEELEQDLILTHFAFLNYENILFTDIIFKNKGLDAIDLMGSIPPLSFFFLSNPCALDLKTTRSDFRDVDALSDRVDFIVAERHRKTMLSYLFVDAKENLIEIEQAADENIERSDHSFDNYCGNDCIECFLHSDFYAQLDWILFKIHTPFDGTNFTKQYSTKRLTEATIKLINRAKLDFRIYNSIAKNSGLKQSKFLNIYLDTMDFIFTGLYNGGNILREVMKNNIYRNADFYDSHVANGTTNTLVFSFSDFSLSSAIFNFIAAGHSLKIIKQANSLTAHAIIGRFVLPELADTTIFPRASIKYEFRLFDHGCLINPSGVPWLNTILLITSGMTVTVSHIFFKARRLNWSISFLFLTIILSIFFLKTQCLEYIHSSFAINDSVYGSAFYMLTGFHGFHVIVGTIFLIVCLIRLFLNHFHKNGHLGFEAAIWYWHFVDVIWIGLYFFVYFWPNNYFFHSHYIHNHFSTSNFKMEELSYSCPIRSIDIHPRPREWSYDTFENSENVSRYFSTYQDFKLPCGQSSKCLLLFSLYKYDLKLDGLLCNMFVFSRKEVDLDWIEVAHQVRERTENKGIISWYVKYRRMGLHDGTLQKEWKHSYFKYCDNKVLYNPRWTNRKKSYWEEY